MADNLSNGQLHHDFEGLRDELVRERTEMKNLANEVRDASTLQCEVMRQQCDVLKDVEKAIVHLSSTVMALRRSVPVEVFGWVFAVVFLLIAGIAGLKVFVPTL